MIRKNIFWFPERALDKKDRDNGLCLADVRIVIGYKERTLKGFMEMAAMLRETFPDLKDEEIYCGEVRGCDSMNRCTVVCFRRPMDPSGLYPQDWSQITCTKQNRSGPDYDF